MDITSKIKQELNNVLAKLNITEQVNFVVEIPKDNTNGDYATNKNFKKKPKNDCRRNRIII